MKISYLDEWIPNPQVIKCWDFPDGQPHVSMPSTRGNHVEIRSRIANPHDLFNVLLAADAAHRGEAKGIDLYITYLMGARMDRPMPHGPSDGFTSSRYHPFTLKVVADVLATGRFDRIWVLDPHSDVSTAILDATAISPSWYVGRAVQELRLRGESIAYLVAPDAGASKKVFEYSQKSGIPMLQCLKHRDMATGELSGFQVVPPGEDETLEGKTVLITDDICDGGGTFVGLAQKLREIYGVAKVYLYVTHGIFSKGASLAYIDHIYTTDSYQDAFPAPRLTVFNV